MPRLHDENNDSRVLPLTSVQYTMLQQWAAGNFTGDLQNPPPPRTAARRARSRRAGIVLGRSVLPRHRGWPDHDGPADLWRAVPHRADHETRTDHGGQRAAMAGRLRGLRVGDAGIHRMVAGATPGSRAARELADGVHGLGARHLRRAGCDRSRHGRRLASPWDRPFAYDLRRAPCSSRRSAIRRCRAAS